MSKYMATVGEARFEFEVRMPGQCVLVDGEPTPVDSAGKGVWRRTVAYVLREDETYRDEDGPRDDGVLTWDDVSIEEFDGRRAPTSERAP